MLLGRGHCSCRARVCDADVLHMSMQGQGHHMHFEMPTQPRSSSMSPHSSPILKLLCCPCFQYLQLYTDIAGQVDVAPGGLQGDPQQQQQGQPSQAPSQQQQQQQDTAPRPGSAGDAQAQHGGHSVGRR